jgi:hypothetical protein
LLALADPRERKDKLSNLRGNLLATVIGCREEGTRAGEPPVSRELDALGEELGELLVKDSQSSL